MKDCIVIYLAIKTKFMLNYRNVSFLVLVYVHCKNIASDLFLPQELTEVRQLVNLFPKSGSAHVIL